MTKEAEDKCALAKEIIKKMLYEYQRLCLIKKETLTEAEQFLEEARHEHANHKHKLHN